LQTRAKIVGSKIAVPSDKTYYGYLRTSQSK
jgi:hypothetical protein